MKYYLIFGTRDNGYSTAMIKTRGNKYEAIKIARENCVGTNYVPVIVKRISQKMFLFINIINKTEGEDSKGTAEMYHAEIDKAIDSVPNATKEFVEAWKAKNDEICEKLIESK